MELKNKKKHPISPLTLQQQSALRGVMAAAQQGFMKQYFFFNITTDTQPWASHSAQIRV